MNRIFRPLLFSLVVISALACQKYDDSDIRSKISGLDGRVSKLESLVQTANQNITALQTLTSVLNGAIFVNSVTEISDGYEIKFSNGKTATLKNGTDGHSPVVGVKKDDHGDYCWTIDGQWLLDENGNKICATGETGAPGITPQMKIESGHWFVSTDNGATWTDTGQATGDPGTSGDSFFKKVTYDENFVYVTLADGTELKLSRGANGVKAITAVPYWSDGFVGAVDKEFKMRFSILPEEAAAALADMDAGAFKLGVAYTALTKASPGDEAELPILKKEILDGKLVLTVDGSALAGEFVNGTIGASAILSVSDNVNAITSGYFSMRMKPKFIAVKAGEDLQAAIDQVHADEDIPEVRVAANAVFKGTIFLKDDVRMSGGWINDFSEQDLSHRSVIDGEEMQTCVNYDGTGNATLSAFEIRNGLGSGIVFSGRLLVEYCWIHNCFNDGPGGGITNASNHSVEELFLANSIIEYNKADAHGGAIFVGGNYGYKPKMTIVNCFIRGNASIAQYGYTGAVHGQGGVQAYLANNTIVENVNWRDGSSATSTPWSAVMFRNGGTHIEMVNNIVAGNYYFKPGVANDPDNTDRYDMPIKPQYILEMQVQNIDLNVVSGDDPNWVCRDNLLGGADSGNFIGRAGNGANQSAAQEACTFVHNSDYSTIFVNAPAGDYRPTGPALGVGENSEYVRSLLGPYFTDLDGKPRDFGGQLYAGCYQP